MGALATAILLAAVSLAHAEASLAQDRSPDHYRKVDEIVQIASERGCESAVAVLRARYAISVTNAQCVPELLWTSLPAKYLLTFTLEGKPYRIHVTASPAGRRGQARTPEAAPNQPRTPEAVTK